VNRIRRYADPVVLIVAALLLSSCGIFGDKEDDELEPKELLKLEDKLRVKKLWTAKVGGDTEFLLMGLRPVGDGNRIYAAGADGDVIAVDPQSGKEHWKTKLEAELSSGPGVNGGIVVVGTKDGFVIVLDATSGS
jgi:outer membrane protein assembly factor BamB